MESRSPETATSGSRVTSALWGQALQRAGRQGRHRLLYDLLLQSGSSSEDTERCRLVNGSWPLAQTSVTPRCQATSRVQCCGCGCKAQEAVTPILVP